MGKLKQQSGFTLIELVVVIVILGILAATALPRFVNLGADARAAAANGLRGAVTSAANMAYGQALARSQTGPTGTLTVPGAGTVALDHGWPDETGIVAMIQDSGGGDAATANGTVTWTFGGIAGCTVTYAPPAAANGTPTISAARDGDDCD